MNIAIDPGPTKSGFVYWCRDGSPLPFVGAFGHIDNADIRCMIRSSACTGVACEMVASYGMAVGAEVFGTVREIGRYQQIAEDDGLPFDLIYRRDVKLRLCGSARAKDPNVRQALIDLYGGDSVAIGGRKCKPCAGKGGRRRERTQCIACDGTGMETPRGPLYGLASHAWPALGVAVVASELRREARQ